MRPPSLRNWRRNALQYRGNYPGDRYAASGGGGGGVVPTDFPNLHRWYKADSYGVLADNTTVANGSNLWFEEMLSGDDADRPGTGVLYRAASGGVFGTSPYLQFGAGFLNYLPDSLTDFTLMVVHRKSGGLFPIITYNAGTGDQFRASSFGDNLPYFSGSTDDAVGTAIATPTDVMSLVCSRTGSDVIFRQNKTSRGTGTSAGAAQFSLIGGGDPVVYDVAEFLLWTTPLTTGEMDELYDDYLKPRYSTLP